MNTSELRDALETRQVWIYFAAVIVAVAVGLLVPSTEILEGAINPALARKGCSAVGVARHTSRERRACPTRSRTTSGTWQTKPARIPCMGCHDADAATAHIKSQVYDPTPANPWSGDEVEACQTCHAPAAP